MKSLTMPLAQPVKNPFSQHSPEWALYESLVGLEAQARAFQADADRNQLRATAAREKAELYRQALIKLGIDPKALPNDRA